jgi:hypothetical protein
MCRSIAFVLVPALLLLACDPPDEVPNGNGEDPPEVTCGPEGDAGAPPEGAPSVVDLIDLGADCLNAGYITVDDGLAYVSCGGAWGADAGRIAVVDLDDLEVIRTIDVGGMPGELVVSGDRLFIADGTEGQLFVAALDGTVVHGSADPVVICPSDFDANLYQFISGIAPAPDGELLVSCFSSAEVIRFTYVEGATGEGAHHAEITGRAVAGDSTGHLARWDGAAVVLDGLAGTLSRVDLGTGLEADVGRWQVGESPNLVSVAGDSAVVVNSLSHTVQHLDLSADPAEATVGEVFIGDGTNPWGLARLGDDRVLVSLLMSNQIALVDLDGGRVEACVDLPEGEDLRPIGGLTPQARPQTIALTGDGRALIALTNYDESWMLAGHGLIAVVDLGDAAQ